MQRAFTSLPLSLLSRLTILTLGVVAACLFSLAALPSLASANNGGVSAYPACPISAAEGRIVVNFDPREFLYGAGSESGPYGVSIPAGTYDITLVSFDNHSEKGGQGQTEERWQLKLLDSAGLLVGVSALISDLPDAEDILVERVNESFVLASDVVKLRPFHPDEGNSIRPLCAAFDRIEPAEEKIKKHDGGGQSGEITGGTGSESSSAIGATEQSTEQTGGSSGGGGCSECGGIGGGGVTGTPLVVSEEQAQWIGRALVVTWRTNIPATGRVYYGTRSVEPPLLDEHLGYATSTLLATTTLTYHSVEIPDADPTQTYFLRPASQETAEQNFRTVGRELTVAPVGAALEDSFWSEVSVRTGVPIATLKTLSVERTGAALSCSPYLAGFIRPGAENNVAEVAKLQLFLWQYESFRDVLITGTYDERTRAAVETFQIRYAADILIPWGLTSPTGHVYLTTQKKVNELYCARAVGSPRNFALSADAEAEIRAYREALDRERERRGTPAWQPTEPEVGVKEGSVTDTVAGATDGDAATPMEGTLPESGVAGGEGGGVPVAPEDGIEGESPKPSPLDGAALIVEEVGDRFATATKNGLVGALFAGFSGPSAPTFLGILSLVLLIAGATMLIRSLRSGRSGGDQDPFLPPPPPPPFGGAGEERAGTRTPPFPGSGSRSTITPPPPPVPPQTGGWTAGSQKPDKAMSHGVESGRREIEREGNRQPFAASAPFSVQGTQGAVPPRSSDTPIHLPGAQPHVPLAGVGVQPHMPAAGAQPRVPEAGAQPVAAFLRGSAGTPLVSTGAQPMQPQPPFARAVPPASSPPSLS